MSYVASATVIVEHAGTKVLCDPWLTDGIYYGSWFHYPAPALTPEDLADVDAIYVSHVHPDHFDAATMARLPKTLPVVVHRFEERFLRRMVEGLGFEHVVEIENGERHELAPGFAIELFAADNCDPAVCGASFGCAPPSPAGRSRQIDSLAVFTGGGKTIVNVNDCPYALARSACDAILARHGSVDMLLAGYSGAGPYPQCFDDYGPDELRRRAAGKQELCLGIALQFVEHLAPEAFMPFAGQYTLGGRLAGLNHVRGVPELEELPDLLGPRLAGARTPRPPRLVLLDSGEAYDLDAREASAPFVGPDPAARERHVRDVLAHATYGYDDAGLPRRDLTDDLRAAHVRMLRKQDEQGYRSDWSFYFDTGEDHVYRVPFDGTPPHAAAAAHPSRTGEPSVRISLPHALLEQILHRQAHLNNAEIGSHLRFSRSPDVFERRIHELACYLQC